MLVGFCFCVGFGELFVVGVFVFVKFPFSVRPTPVKAQEV
jgi:hypothetical protein